MPGEDQILFHFFTARNVGNLFAAAGVAAGCRNQFVSGTNGGQQGSRDDQRTVGKNLDGVAAGGGFTAETGQSCQIAAFDDADVFVEFVGFAVVEDIQNAIFIIGGDHTFNESAHDLFGSFAIDLDVEGDHAAESGSGISIAGFLVNIEQRFALASHGGTGGIDMFHHRAAGSFAILDDVECAGNVFQIGLGKTALAVFQNLHGTDGTFDTGLTVKCRRLMGVGTIAQVLDFFVKFPGDLHGCRIVADILFQIG